MLISDWSSDLCSSDLFTSLGFIDRFLVTAEAYDIPAKLIFNKLDLFSEAGLEVLDDYKAIYDTLGYPCYTVSALQGINIETVRALLHQQTSLVIGHSGVGKSTLINAIHPTDRKSTRLNSSH